jgi:putative flippase GtrA
VFNNYRFLRFLVVGGINTLFGFALYSGLILLGTRVWLALLLANVAGVLFNFFTTSVVVFRTSLRRRMLRFVGVYLAIYLVNLALLSAARHVFGNAILAQALLVLPMAVLSYLLMRRFVFHAAVAEG